MAQNRKPTKNKATRNKGAGRKKTGRKGSRGKSSSKSKSLKNRNINRLLILAGIFLITISILYITPNFRRPLLLTVISLRFVSPYDWATDRVQKVMDLHNSIAENESNKDALSELLSDYIVWFKADQNARPQPKERRNSYSSYDQFHFISRTTYDIEDRDNHNYEMRFTGLFVFRNPERHEENDLVKVQSFLVKIENQLVSKINVINKEKGKSFETVNKLYRNSRFFTFIALIILALGIIVLFKLPREILISIWNRIIKMF